MDASDDPADQDKAREIRVMHDYASLKKQIGSKKKPQKVAVDESRLDKDPPPQFEKGDADRGNPDYMKSVSYDDEKKWERLQRMRKASKKKEVRDKVEEGKLTSVKATTYGMPPEERKALIDAERKRQGVKPRPKKNVDEEVGISSTVEMEKAKKEAALRRKEQQAVDKEKKALKKEEVVNETVSGGVPMTPQELEIQKKMSRLNMRLARKRNQEMQKAKVQDTETAPEQVKEDKAFDNVDAALRAKHGKDAVLTKDSPKPKVQPKPKAKPQKPLTADEKAHREVIARYGGEANYKAGRGLGT